MSRRFWVTFWIVWAGTFMAGYYLGLHWAGAR